MNRALMLAACGLTVGLAGCEAAETAQASEGDAPAARQAAAGPIIIGDREPAETGAIAMPALRPGLWQVTTVDDMGERSARMCLDEAIQREVNIFGGQLHAPFCGQAATLRREEMERWTYSNVCRMGDVAMTLEGEVEGNMENRYSHTLTMVTRSPVGADTTTIRERGRHAGPCPRGMAAGDFEMEGMRMNLRQVMALGQMMAPGAFGGMPDGFVPEPD